MGFDEREKNDLKSILASLEPDLNKFRMIIKLVDTYATGVMTDNRFIEIKEICKVILNNVPFMLTLLDRTYITRARQNTGLVFSRPDEISYNKDASKVSQGRFNLAGEPAFYGCLPTFRDDGKLINYRNQCPLFEVCKAISNGDGMSFPGFFTLGFWRLKSQLPVLNLCYDQDHLIANPAINAPISAYIANVKEIASAEAFDFILEVWRYFSGLARSWDKNNELNHYFILTAFFHAFRESYRETRQTECVGIIYPSAMTQAKGLNIVMNPTTVEKHLELIKVQMYLLRSWGLPHGYEPLSEPRDVVDGHFAFEKKMLFWYNMAMHNWSEINEFEG